MMLQGFALFMTVALLALGLGTIIGTLRSNFENIVGALSGARSDEAMLVVKRHGIRTVVRSRALRHAGA